jgi:predicted RNase H-like HicB family nuclease
MDNGKDYAEVVLNVLGYREDGGWVALALEMDLRGYGETFEAALDELTELIEMQISFAAQQGMPEMVLEPADAVWFERWAELRRKRLLDIWAHGDRSVLDEDYRLSAIPPPHVIANLAEFSQVDA